MPDWFYPLMLVVALAGCAFLFVQGRSTSRVLDAMRRRLDTIEATLREGSTRAMPEVAELASAASDPDARTLDDLQGLLAEQPTVIVARRGSTRRPPRPAGRKMSRVRISSLRGTRPYASLVVPKSRMALAFRSAVCVGTRCVTGT